MDQRDSQLRKCIVVLVAVAMLVPLIFTLSATPSSGQASSNDSCDPYRIFYSDDRDYPERTDSNITNLTKAKNVQKRFSPGEFACIADIAIQTTNPNFLVGNNLSTLTTLPRLQQSRIREYDRGRNDSVRLPRNGQPVTNGSIAKAHITLVGVMGGAQPTFGTGGSEKATYMSQSGTIMNFADYKINESADPDVCRPKVYSVQIEEYVENETNATNSTGNLSANISTSTVQVVQNATPGTTVNTTVRGDSVSFDVQQPENGTSLPTFEEVVSGRNLTDNISSGTAPIPSASDSITIQNISQSCSYYTYSSRDVSRSVTIGGNTYTKSGGFDETAGPYNVEKSSGDKDLRLFNYNEDITGNSTLELSATFASEVFMTPLDRSWSPSGSGQSESSGSWNSLLRVTQVENIRTDRVTTNISKPIVFTEPQDPDITQKVIKVSEDQQYTVINFPSGSDNSSISGSEAINGTAPVSTLRTRPIWMNMTAESGFELQGPWNVFSMRARGSLVPYRLSSDFPGVPVTRMYADRREPSVISASGSGTQNTFTQVIGYQARNLSTTGSTLPQGVNLYAPDPVVMDKIVVQNAPGGFQELTTIHGETISLESGIEEIPYREPQVNVTQTGSSNIRVKVRDPETNAPLAGRTVYMQGTENTTHVTNENGVVTANRTGAFVRAESKADDFQNIGDIFYGSTVVTKTFNPFGVLSDRIINLIVASLAATPLIIGYFWWRGVRSDNQHTWQ